MPGPTRLCCGGPNHVGNLCSAPILVNPADGVLMHQSSYWYVGHFSRFIQPGAQRVLCAATRETLLCTAFANPDGSVVAVVMNRSHAPIRLLISHGHGEGAAPAGKVRPEVGEGAAFVDDHCDAGNSLAVDSGGKKKPGQGARQTG